MVAIIASIILLSLAGAAAANSPALAFFVAMAGCFVVGLAKRGGVDRLMGWLLIGAAFYMVVAMAAVLFG